MLRSFARIMDVQPGFHAEHVLAAEIPSPWRLNGGNGRTGVDEKVRYFGDVLERLRIPGVNAAGLISGLPLGTVATQTLIGLEGREAAAGTDLRVGYSSVSPEYFRTMGISPLQGRAFTDADTAERPMVAMINAAMARHLWPNEDPIGKRFTFKPGRNDGRWVTVVGIGANVRNFGITTEPDSQLYVSFRQSLLSPQNAAVVVRTPLNPAALAGAVRAAVYQADANQPVSNVRTMAQAVADSVA